DARVAGLWRPVSAVRCVALSFRRPCRTAPLKRIVCIARGLRRGFSWWRLVERRRIAWRMPDMDRRIDRRLAYWHRRRRRQRFQILVGTNRYRQYHVLVAAWSGP